MKKLYIVFLFTFLYFTSNIYSVDFSLGFNAAGFGFSFSRGDYYNSYLDAFSKNNSKGLSTVESISFNEAISFNVDVLFHKYFAFETGLGYGTRVSGYSYENYNGYDKVMIKHTLCFISLPLYLINRYEIKNVGIYFLFGPKFNLRVSYNAEETVNIGGLESTKQVYLNPSMYNMFVIDLTFAIGAEYKFYKNQYFGIRVGYNLNVLGGFSKYNADIEKWEIENYFIDNLSLSLTYRYLFSKK